MPFLAFGFSNILTDAQSIAVIIQVHLNHLFKITFILINSTIFIISFLGNMPRIGNFEFIFCLVCWQPPTCVSKQKDFQKIEVFTSKINIFIINMNFKLISPSMDTEILKVNHGHSAKCLRRLTLFSHFNIIHFKKG